MLKLQLLKITMKKKKIYKKRAKKLGLLNKVYEDFKNKQKIKEKKELKFREEQIKKEQEKLRLKEEKLRLKEKEQKKKMRK